MKVELRVGYNWIETNGVNVDYYNKNEITNPRSQITNNIQ